MQDLLNKLTTEELNKFEKEIVKIYSDTLIKVTKDLKNVIDKLDMDLEPEERLTYLNKKNRLEGLLKLMMNDIHKSNLEAVKKINEFIIQTFINNQEYGAYLVEHTSGVELSWSLYSKDVVKGIVTGSSNPFYMLALDSFKDKDLVYRALQRELTQGILLGEGIPKLAKRIQKIVGGSRYDSIRIARTETTRAENAGRLDSFKQAEDQGLKIKKQWLATIDSRTRKSHADLNFETVALDKKFSNGLEHPGGNGKASEVVNCRCTMTVDFTGLEITEKERKLNEDLKRMSFAQWQENYKERKKGNGK